MTLIYVTVKKEVCGCARNRTPGVYLTACHFADRYCRLYSNVNKKCFKFQFCHNHNEMVLFLNSIWQSVTNFSGFPSFRKLHTRVVMVTKASDKHGSSGHKILFSQFMWQSDSQVAGKYDYIAHRKKDENCKTHRNLNSQSIASG